MLYLIDIRPLKGNYQPVPWLRISSGKRAIGTAERWEAIRKNVEGMGAKVAVDIGCNAGFFSLKLAELGISTVGYESSSRFFRIALRARESAGVGNVLLTSGCVTPETVDLIPDTDICLCLSVWHHWVRIWGFDVASKMLADLVAKTENALFFDTGESEMPTHYGLPEMGADPEDWLRRYLIDLAGPNDVVSSLGRFRAFAPGTDESGAVVLRTLFMIDRAGSD
jgi:SAM-dependent methyltransferase